MTDVVERLKALLQQTTIETEADLRAAQRTVLKATVGALTLTSGYLIRHDAVARTSTVLVAYYTESLDNVADDTGVVYDETEYPSHLLWLQLPTPPTRELHADQLKHSDGEVAEFARYGVKSALYIPIMVERVVWG